MRHTWALATMGVLAATNACDDDPTRSDSAPPTQDGAVGDEKADSENSLAALDNATYFAVTLAGGACSGSRCAAFAGTCTADDCGAYAVRRLNFATTRCQDGRYEAQCPVDVVDIATLGLAPSDMDALFAALADGEVVLRGAIATPTDREGDEGRVFVASEAWRADSAVAGTDGFFAVTTLKIACLTMTCRRIHGVQLNHGGSGAIGNYGALDLSQTGASEAERALAETALADRRILVSATVETRPGPGGTRVAELKATQFLLQVVPAVAPGDDDDCN